MNDQALLVCKSIHHGNTRAIAEHLAGVLDARIVDPDDLSILPESSRLIGIGSGIFYGRFHRAIRDWIYHLPKRIGRDRDAFLYSTCGLSFFTKLYHQPIKKALEDRGFKIVGEYCCPGHDTFGPLSFFGGLNRKRPNANDLRLAELFAARVKARSRAYVNQYSEKATDQSSNRNISILN